jgi:hypothetical protein
MTDIPNVRAIRADEGRRLAITWTGGSESVVDVTDHLAEYAVFATLRADDDHFRKVEIGEWGWCVRWSDEMEISADTLWRMSVAQGAV